MNAANKEKSTVTKRDLATRVRLTLKPDVKMHQALVADVITHTLDAIRDALVNGNTVELRNFGVFKIEIRKERIGRNPKDPSVDIRIPARKVVKFRSGKEMKNQLDAAASAEAQASAAPEPGGAGFDSE
ncbi:MAG: HU family DNA-binding protein [Verrucomicrobiota bacterium]|jgi:nucleoid DNA-binding protein|nr:HU family DNA-binding protein [Verrucomicrobiota bacterium]MDP6251859.1 HU family DNA-binding protein [Verrucomicrobiota bacterium]MDP7178281.1 HU family DNA-binding protein [Verrucomicrobiota bacterium]MDP7441473.1 HU family DNA-binding protein [Verrucomicrobiota bacterium]